MWTISWFPVASLRPLVESPHSLHIAPADIINYQHWTLLVRLQLNFKDNTYLAFEPKYQNVLAELLDDPLRGMRKPTQTQRWYKGGM